MNRTHRFAGTRNQHGEGGREETVVLTYQRRVKTSAKVAAKNVKEKKSERSSRVQTRRGKSQRGKEVTALNRGYPQGFKVRIETAWKSNLGYTKCWDRNTVAIGRREPMGGEVGRAEKQRVQNAKGGTETGAKKGDRVGYKLKGRKCEGGGGRSSFFFGNKVSVEDRGQIKGGSNRKKALKASG